MPSQQLKLIIVLFLRHMSDLSYILYIVSYLKHKARLVVYSIYLNSFLFLWNTNLSIGVGIIYTELHASLPILFLQLCSEEHWIILSLSRSPPSVMLLKSLLSSVQQLLS